MHSLLSTPAPPACCPPRRPPHDRAPITIIRHTPSPRAARPADKLVARGRNLISMYEEVGVPRNRVLLRIPATWEGIQVGGACVSVWRWGRACGCAAGAFWSLGSVGPRWPAWSMGG